MKSPKNREGPGGCFYKYKEKAYMFDILIFHRHIQDWFESLKIYINIVQTVSRERGSGGLYVNDFVPWTLHQYHIFQNNIVLDSAHCLIAYNGVKA